MGDETAGYVTTSDNLSVFVMRNAGHMVPRSQPRYGKIFSVNCTTDVGKKFNNFNDLITCTLVCFAVLPLRCSAIFSMTICE